MNTIQKVLMPTDFSIASLNLVKEVADRTVHHHLDIRLVYGLHLSNSITELLFFSKNKVLDSLQSADFMEACSLLKNKYFSKIISIQADLIVGNNRNYINHYIHAEAIDRVFVPAYYTLNTISRKYFDPSAALAKAEIGVTRLMWPGSTQIPFTFTNQLSDLFLHTSYEPDSF
jgi:hypothetical protein